MANTPSPPLPRLPESDTDEHDPERAAADEAYALGFFLPADPTFVPDTEDGHVAAAALPVRQWKGVGRGN